MDVLALPEVDRIMTPSLVVFMERVRENVARLIAHAGNADRLRVHVKTTKMPEVWAELFEAGIRSFKCATPRELEHLLPVVEGGDVLVAYPHRGPNLTRIVELARAHPRTQVSVVVEDPDLEVPEPLGVFADLNGGMDRTGIPLEDRATIAAVARHARYRGLHCYEGHVHGGPLAERKVTCNAIYDALVDLVREIGAEEVITSGTPSFVPALAYDRLRELTTHRVSPGTVIFSDQRSQTDCEELDFVPAAFVLSRVVSHPRLDRFTCDAGSKAIAAEAGAPVAVVLDHPEWRALTPNEEHLPFQVTGGQRPARGTPLFLFPRHVCPTVNLAETAILVDEGETKVVPVRGRAH